MISPKPAHQCRLAEEYLPVPFKVHSSKRHGEQQVRDGLDLRSLIALGTKAALTPDTLRGATQMKRIGLVSNPPASS